MNTDNSVSVSFHVLRKDKEFLFSLAKQNGRTVSSFCRDAIMETINLPSRSVRMKQKKKLELAKILSQFNKVGNNLNQLAKLANSGFVPNANELEETLAEINNAKAEIMKMI